MVKDFLHWIEWTKTESHIEPFYDNFEQIIQNFACWLLIDYICYWISNYIKLEYKDYLYIEDQDQR